MPTDTISAAQMRMVHAHYKGVTRDDRLQAISLIVSRRIHTTRDLTRGEASTLIDRLEQERWQPAW